MPLLTILFSKPVDPKSLQPLIKKKDKDCAGCFCNNSSLLLLSTKAPDIWLKFLEKEVSDTSILILHSFTGEAISDFEDKSAIDLAKRGLDNGLFSVVA